VPSTGPAERQTRARVSVDRKVQACTFERVDAASAMFDAEWASALRPFLSRKVRVRCGSCNRQLDTLVAGVSEDASWIRGERVPSERLGVPVASRAQQARPRVVIETFGHTHQGRRWTCPCGSKFERNLVKLRPVFLRQVRAGADLVLEA